MDLRDKINKLSLQAQTTPLGSTCDTRLLFEVLNEVEEILDANPSKALYELDNMANYRIEYSEYSMPIKDTSEYKTIRQTLLKAQKQEKILNIIKERQVDIALLATVKDVEEYNFYIPYIDCERSLTKEEFGSLKEMISNE